MSLSDIHLPENPTFLRKILPWLVICVGATFYCYEFFLRVAPNTMSEHIMKFYKIGAGEFGLLTAFYAAAYTPMQLVVGILMDHYGARRLLSLSILCCVAGCYLISVYNSLYLGKLGFFLMGFGSAFAFVGVLKLAVNWLPANKLSLVSGIATALGLLGGIFAETLLDMILTVITWRQAWYYAGIVGILILVVNFIFVRDHPKEKLPHVANIPNASWKELFIDLKDILTNYKFILNGIIGCILLLPISVFANTWANLFFQQAGSMSHEIVTVYLVPSLFMGMVFGGPLAGIISEFIGRRKIIYQISILVSAVLFTNIILYPGMGVNLLMANLFTLGLFTGGQILVFVIGIELTAKEAAATASACTNFLVTLGPVIFLPLIGFLLDYQWDGLSLNDMAFYSKGVYQYALLTMPACYLFAFLFTMLLDDTHPKAKARELAYEEQLITVD